MKNYGNIKILPDCAVCHSKLDKANFSLISSYDSKLIFHVACSRCKTAALLNLSAEREGLIGIGVMTDLDKNEAGEKLAFGSISADEMIEAYEMIKKIN